MLGDWPLAEPRSWLDLVNQPQTEAEERYASLHPARLPLRKERLGTMHAGVPRSGVHTPSTGPAQGRGRIGDQANYPVYAPDPFNFRETLIDRSNVQDFGDTGGVSADGGQQKK